MRRVEPKQVKKMSFSIIAGSKEGGVMALNGNKKIKKAVAEIKENGFKRPDNKFKMGAIFHLEHWRGDQLLAERHEENLCPDEFINYMLDVGLSDGTKIAAWYCLIFNDNHTPAAGDTYAVPGFTESTDYDETTRPAWTEAGVSSKVITNSASKATFTMNGTDTSIYGAAIVGGGSTPSTKDDQAGGGKLGPEAQFTGGAVTGIVADDVLKVYVTITGSDV